MTDLTKEVISRLQLSFDPLNFVGILATILASLYIFKADLPFDYVKERHEKLIFPLFNLLEPSLYQKIDAGLLKKACDLIEQNKSFADGKLLSLHYYCTLHPSQKTFMDLCSYIDHAYDSSCRRLKLKRRSVEYRINRNQYKSKLYFISYLVLHSLIFIVSLFACLIAFFTAMILFEILFDSSNESTQLVFCLIGSLVFLTIHKYIEKHL